MKRSFLGTSYFPSRRIFETFFKFKNIKKIDYLISRVYIILVCLGLEFISFSCSRDSLPQAQNLNNLRVLGLLSDKPEVNPSNSSDFPITIRPLISDINETSSLTYNAQICLDPGISFGQEASCDNQSSKVTLGSGSITTLDISKRFTGLGNSISISFAVVSSYLTYWNQLDSFTQFNGLNLILTYSLVNSRGEQKKAFRRITLSSRSVQNQNPIITNILSSEGGAYTPSGIEQTKNIYPQLGSSSELYQVQKADGSFKSEQEEILVSWFSTYGSLKRPRTLSLDQNEFTSLRANHDPEYFIVLARDNRGGVGAYFVCIGTCTGITSGPL